MSKSWSVEIPEAAVEAGMERMAAWVFTDDARADFDWSGLDEDDKADALNAMRIALEAALPYLAPAVFDDEMQDSKSEVVIDSYDRATLEYLTAAGLSAQLVERVRRLALENARLKAERVALSGW